MFDPSSLPEAPAVQVRCEPDYYGASHLIAAAVGLPQPPKSTSSWVHGCDMFPIPRTIFTPQCPEPRQTHLVGSPTVARWFHDNAYPKAIPVGCPFIYTSPSGMPRIPGSVLAMPSHGLPGSKRDDAQTSEWFARVAELREHFPTVAVCLHADDAEALKPLLEEHRLPSFTGASLHAFSLPRIRAMFESFELVVSDVQGSHLPYAAWCGCKVALLEPLFERKWEHFKDHILYQKRPELIQNLVFHETGFIRNRLPFLFPVDLAAAPCPREWASELLGDHFKRTPQEMARLLGWKWDAEDPAFTGIVYADAASWLGASNPNVEADGLRTKLEEQKTGAKDQRKALQQAEKSLGQLAPFASSFSGKLGRLLYSLEKRLLSRTSKGGEQEQAD